MEMRYIEFINKFYQKTLTPPRARIRNLNIFVYMQLQKT